MAECDKCCGDILQGCAACSSCGRRLPKNTSALCAGFWSRAVAHIIDLFALQLSILMLSLILMTAKSGPFIKRLSLLPSFEGVLVLLSWLYFASMESSPYQATFGKIVLGLHVTDLHGAQLSFGKASGRFFGKIFSYATLGAGFIMAAWTAKHQALHDKLAGCLVLRRSLEIQDVSGLPVLVQKPLPSRNAAIILLSCLLGFLFVLTFASQQAYFLFAFFKDLRHRTGRPGIKEGLIQIAKEGDAGRSSDSAEFDLGRMNYRGEGLPQDHSAAARHYLKAAEQGFAAAQTMAGVLYSQGDGVPQSYSDAIKWLDKAASQNEAHAYNGLEVVHKLARVGAAAGRFGYKVAGMTTASSGDPTLLFFSTGSWARAAREGDVRAQFNLGVMYENGPPYPPDLDKALEWWRLAAKSDIDAVFNIADLYLARKTPEGYAEAMTWYRKAAALGYPEAAISLGVMYERGQGVPKDYAKARELFQLAASEGNQNAPIKLESLQNDMNLSSSHKK